MSKNTIRSIVVLAVALVLIIVGFFVWKGVGKQQVTIGEPVDIVQNFYEEWLIAAQSTTTTPYEEGLADSPLLSKSLRKYITKEQHDVDPVLCHGVVPERLATRIVYQTESAVEAVVTARQSTSTEQSIVELTALNGGWYISDIRCSLGEFAPEREFTFDQEGFLLKSVPKPLDPKFWYVIFEEHGQEGHYAPLLLTAKSMCRIDGVESVCNPETFTETAEVLVRGSMTETGVDVKYIEFKK